MMIQIDGEDLSFDIKKYDSRYFFILKGKKGAVVLSKWGNLNTLSIDYHAKKQQRKGQEQQEQICEFIDCKCFGDGRAISKHINDIDVLKLLKVEYDCLD